MSWHSQTGTLPVSKGGRWKGQGKKRGMRGVLVMLRKVGKIGND
jgi:hypothetical protein